MNCLPSSIVEKAEPVLVASAGVTHSPPPALGDLSDWLALMEVVEALCPQ